MKPILIISYYFPPASFVGGDRTMSWYLHFNKFGFYPIVITRQWEENQKDETLTPSFNELVIEKSEFGEIHRLPHVRNFRDKIAIKNDIISVILRKALTFIELISLKFSIRYCNYKNIYIYAEEYLKNHEECRTLIISGKPFNSFHFGFALKNKFSNLNWIADYRDEWTTFRNANEFSILDRIVFKLDRWSEKRWLSNASGFTSTALPIIDRIEKFTKVNGHLVLNGFENFNLEKKDIPHSISFNNKLILLYSGTLYHYQSIEIIIESIKKFNKLNYEGFLIQLYWIGIDVVPKEHKRALKLINNDENFIVLPRMTKIELEKYYQITDCFFLTSYDGHKGWLPVKIFDYLSFFKPILLVPSDNDVMDNLILETKAGYTANKSEDCLLLFKKLVDEKKQIGRINHELDFKMLGQYSRENQTKNLASFINQIIS